jgi:hypothetical protein
MMCLQLRSDCPCKLSAKLAPAGADKSKTKRLQIVVEKDDSAAKRPSRFERARSY